MSFKKTVSIALTICMLFSCFQLNAFAKINNKADSFDITGNSILLEAEKVTIKKAQGVSIQKSTSASGSKYVLAEKDWRNEDYAQESAAVEFFFVPKTDGVYKVWIRFAANGDGADSIFISDNGADFVQAPQTKSTGGEEIYNWAKVLTTPLLKAGEKYNVGFLPREREFRLDQIIVTKTDTTPVGLVSDVNDMDNGAVPTPAPGEGLNEDAVVFETTGGSAMFEIEEATITADKGLELVDNKNASGKKLMQASVSRQTNNPALTERGAAEFYIVPDKSAIYYVWARYSADNDGSDSIFISANGGEYKQAPNTSKTGDDATFAWAKMLTTPKLIAGEKYNIRFMPREKGFRIDQIIVTRTNRFTPVGGDIITTAPDPDAIEIIPVDTTKYPAPTITPPPEHPRVMFRSSDIATIKADMEKSQNVFAASEFRRLVTTDINKGVLKEGNGKENYSDAVLAAIEARAFDYAINGNEQAGREAVEAIKNYLDTIDFGDTVSVLYRKQGYCIFIAGEVYDWCYPLLTADDKKTIVALCQVMASNMEIGWPPVKQGAISGHGSELQLTRDLLSIAIAAYDEYPDMYQMIAGRILSEYVEPREFYGQSGTWHQGVSYNFLRLSSGIWFNYLFKVLCGSDVLSFDQSKVMYHSYLYMHRPDGQLLREGDTMESKGKGVYWTEGFFGVYNGASKMTGGDPYLKRELMRMYPDWKFASTGGYESVSATMFLITNDPDLEPRSLEELPKTAYFGSPYGGMVARTGWSDGYNSPDVIAFMKIGEVYGANHNHLDSGNFQIYYKGILASESGSYIGYGQEYDWAQHKATIAHNSLLIYDPDEVMVKAGNPNRGGQRGPSGEYNTLESWTNGTFDTKFGTVLAHEFGPDPITPAYSYIKGDITNAYSDKVSEVLRSMLFIPTDNEDYPAVFLTMDKVTASNKDFDKYWIMHSQQEPEINGNVSIIKRDTEGYNGMLVNQTLYPTNATVTAVGGAGHENEFNGVAIPDPSRFGKTSCEEISTWRIDVRPSVKTETDYFLNAMYVGDADADLPLVEAQLIESEQMMGAKLLGKVAMFAKDAPKLTEQSFTVNGDESELSFVVTGLDKGGYDISVNGNALTTQIATEDGGTIYFTGPAGSYKISRIDENALRETVDVTLPEYELPIKIRIGTKYIYSDVNPVIVNDRTLLPMRALFENIGAEVSYDGETNSATATSGLTTVTVTEGSDTAYVNGEPVTLDVGAMMINDRFMVPVRFISESMGLQVNWSERGQVVTISGVSDTALLESYGMPKKTAKVESVTCLGFIDGSTLNEPLLAKNAVDLNPATLWAEEGDGRYLLVTLSKEYTINAMAAMFNNASTRTESFSLAVSSDNENWTTVIDHATTDGKTEDFQTFTFNPVKAKYVKYIGHTNSKNGWNALKEIAFIPAE